MNKLVFLVLVVSMFFTCKQKLGKQVLFSSFEQAKLHPLIADKPAIDFFEGALLGNGAMGVVVTTRPDGVVIYFGHNNVWDIRIAEKHRDKIGTFDYVFNKVKSIPDTLSVLTKNPWYKEYIEMARDNYSKPYPRPFPCGSVLLGFDLRNAEMIGHRLDISTGLCEVSLLTCNHKKIRLQLFTDLNEDKLWMRLVDSQGNTAANIFDRIRVMPDPSTPREFPGYRSDENLSGGMLSFRQILPYQEPDKYEPAKGHPKDKAFRLSARISQTLEKSTRTNWNGNKEPMGRLEGGFIGKEGFVGCVSLEEGLNTVVGYEQAEPQKPTLKEFEAAWEKSTLKWKEFWDKSGIILQDPLLERTWYHNLYFLNCSVKEGVTTPGLFANWSYNNIGTAWHGDYHMNYNTQQPFWVTFSSNHLEKKPFICQSNRIPDGC